MSCEVMQEQVSLLIDTELGEEGQVELFRHLEQCPDCRQFFASLIRLRRAARVDEAELLRTAGEILPSAEEIVSVAGRGSSVAAQEPVRAGRTALFRRRAVSQESAPSPAPSRARRWWRIRAAGWKVPVPAAVGLSVLLLAGGALLGSRFGFLPGRHGAEWSPMVEPRPAVVARNSAWLYDGVTMLIFE